MGWNLPPSSIDCTFLLYTRLKHCIDDSLGCDLNRPIGRPLTLLPVIEVVFSLGFYPSKAINKAFSNEFNPITMKRGKQPTHKGSKIPAIILNGLASHNTS